MGDEVGDVDVASTAEENSVAASLPPQVARVRRDTLAACMTCPLCQKLLRDATTISECLHTFCRKCIYEKLTDEEVDYCPICNIDLGCVPLEKLRPDHNLQDLRAKIFPFKRKKVEPPEVASFTLPARRKERSLSALVVGTPRVAKRTSFTGRRTRAVPRRAASLRKRSPAIEESGEKEDADVEGGARSSSSETLTKMIQVRKQNLSNGEPSNPAPKKNTEIGGDCFSDKSELWKPLTCLVEAANRTKSSPQIPIIKSEDGRGPESNLPANKVKVREHPVKAKQEDDTGGALAVHAAQTKVKRVNGVGRKKRGRGTMAQALIDAISAKREKRTGPIWFSLVASFHQFREGDAPLPQISSFYLRIKDGYLPVSFIQKYLVKKLNLASEDEVELTCMGQAVSPTMIMHSLVDQWIQAGSSERVQASLGTSAKDFVMVLSYGRKVSKIPGS